MKSKVYFIPIKPSDKGPAIQKKLRTLLKESSVLDVIQKSDRVAVKVHFGEKGNTGFVEAAHVRVVCDDIAQKGATAFVADTNTLYRGERTNSKDHLQLARDHGFSLETLGAEVIIPDDTQKEATAEVKINQKYIKTAKLARVFVEADALVAVTHFKGHLISGFGGAIKNLAMGCAMREGKMMQHCDVSPVVYTERCVGCGACVTVCLPHAISLRNAKSTIDGAKCIGCASCLAVCPTSAMFIDLGCGSVMQLKMAEMAKAVMIGKKDKAVFINFALKISKECDCWGMENPRIAPDVGILASTDPVSVDKASMDLVNQACAKDIFKATHPTQDGLIQLKAAQELGLGHLNYELINLQAHV